MVWSITFAVVVRTPSASTFWSSSMYLLSMYLLSMSLLSMCPHYLLILFLQNFKEPLCPVVFIVMALLVFVL